MPHLEKGRADSAGRGWGPSRSGSGWQSLAREGRPRVSGNLAGFAGFNDGAAQELAAGDQDFPLAAPGQLRRPGHSLDHGFPGLGPELVLDSTKTKAPQALLAEVFRGLRSTKILAKSCLALQRLGQARKGPHSSGRHDHCQKATRQQAWRSNCTGSSVFSSTLGVSTLGPGSRCVRLGPFPCSGLGGCLGPGLPGRVYSHWRIRSGLGGCWTAHSMECSSRYRISFTEAHFSYTMWSVPAEGGH